MPVLWELLQIPFSFSLIQPFSFSIIYGFQHELIWVEWTSLYLPRKGRKSNGYLSLKSEQKQINSHKVAQHDETTNRKRFSKNMYNFLKIWHIKERKKIFFFPSVYMKMTWIFNYLKVMRRINQSSERKKEGKKINKEIKQKNIFPFIYFFTIFIYEFELALGESANLLTLFWFCLIDER